MFMLKLDYKLTFYFEIKHFMNKHMFYLLFFEYNIYIYIYRFAGFISLQLSILKRLIEFLYVYKVKNEFNI